MNQHQCDLAVIGSGPGGYVAAIRASQLGLKTICIEREKLGGVCLNIGCIPSKALLKSAEYANFLKHAADYGFGVSDVAVDFPQVIKRSRGVADRMSNGVQFLFKKYKVQLVKGNAKLASRNRIEAYDAGGNVTDIIEAKNIIIATGARPRMFPGIEVDRVKVLTSTEAMMQQNIPSSLIVMGAGAIGVEFAYFYNGFGAKVTIIEMQKNLVPVEDEEVSKELERQFRKTGMTLLTETRVLSAKAKGNGVEVIVQKKDGSQETLTADLALNAIGVQGNIENLGLEQLGVTIERGWIKADKFMRTNIEGIYAIGDIAGPPWLAHKASAEGIVCAEHIAGHHTSGVDYGNIPGCTYCNPQIASIGLTEAKARAAGYEVKIGKFPFSANGKAHGIGKADGFVKLVFEAKHGELLGAHLIGTDVTEMIGELGLARALEATGPMIFKTIHAHPTLSEAIMEAAAVGWNEAVNI
ncbi:dihydrolipoyl dehydrogenase [Ignavibacteria bacterium]|nr:dihydrolipoyl dehydrogenase [Bacteroidota bacterium]MCZ2132874.1 dihydrolipoyl dehydrogenase [Bacteroidota bacterium]